MEYIQDTLFGKTLQELSPVTKERTSDAFSKQCAESQMKKFMCLRLTSGNRQDASWGGHYSVAWRTFDAQYWGVPQRRKRIYLVADFAGECASEILFKPESVSWHTPKVFQSRQTVAGCATDCVRAAIAVENHPNDSRVKLSEDGNVQALTSRMGTGGGNVPLVLETPKTLKIRSGCEGGGKGALIQENKSATLGCNNDQVLFCVDQGGGKSACNVTENLSPTLTCTHGGEPCIVYSINEQGGSNLICLKEQTATLTAITNANSSTRCCVAYGIDRAAFNQGVNAKYDFSIEEELMPTMVAKGANACAYGFYPQMKAESIAFAEEKSNCIVNGTNPSYQNGVVALKKEMELTIGHTVDAEAVSKLAKRYTREYKSKADVGEVSAKLKQIFEYIANEDANAEEANKAMFELASQIVNKSETLNTEMRDTFKDELDIIRSARIFILKFTEWA